MGTLGEPQRAIVAMGGGGFSMEPDNPLLDEHVLELARAGRGRQRPRVCFIPTASGDSDGYVASFYAAFARPSEASHLALFHRTIDDLEAFVLPGSHFPHYGGEPERRPTYQRLIAEGALPDGYAAADGAALICGTELAEVVASRPAARGYRVVRRPAGDTVETELPTRYLG